MPSLERNVLIQIDHYKYAIKKITQKLQSFTVNSQVWGNFWQLKSL